MNGQLLAPYFLCGAFNIRKMVAMVFLMRSYQQMRKLSATGAGLRQHLRYRDLKYFLREQKSRLQRDAGYTAPARLVGPYFLFGLCVIHKPLRILLEHRGNHSQCISGRNPLTPFNHRQVGH